MSEDYPCILHNVARRPLELHRDGEVVVIAPGGTIRLDAADPEIALYERDGALTRHAADAEPEPKAEAAEPKARAKPRAAKNSPKKSKPSPTKKTAPADASGELP